MKHVVMFAKFAPGGKITEEEYVPFPEMKRSVQQDVLRLKINIYSKDYRKESNWKLLEDMLMTDIERKYIYSEAWFVEQYLIEPEQYIKVNSCYAMGTRRKLNSEELDLSAMCKALSSHTSECYDMDSESLKRGIARTDKDSLIVRINDLFDFKMDSFRDENEKYKLLFLCSRFEGKFGSKTLGEFLRKPSYENIDNSRARISTVNGEMMAFLKYELEKELLPAFILEAKTTMQTIARGWERQIQSIRGKLDWNLYLDNSEEINRTYNMIGGYAQFYNKKTYCHGRHKHGLLETVYVKLIEHESLGSEYDIIHVAENVSELEYSKTDDADFYKKLASIKVRIDSVDSFLNESYLDMACWVFAKEKTTSNEKDKYKRAAENVKYFLKMFQENTKYKNEDEVDALILVICIREYISLNAKDIVENRHYRAGDLAVKSIKSELHDDTYDTIRSKSQAVWVERVMRRYNTCFHDTELIAKVRNAEKYLDWLFVRNLETNSLEDLRYIHIHFMYEIQGLIYSQVEIEKKKKNLETIFRRKAYKWSFHTPVGDSWSPARQFFSLPIDDVELVHLAKTLKPAMAAALKDNEFKTYDYEIEVIEGYFKDKLSLYFELVVDPKFNQISVNSTRVADRKIDIILKDNNIFV
ncbi:MAG: hypothetical protein ACERKN_08775 [Velocimicrobium sp.]